MDTNISDEVEALIEHSGDTQKVSRSKGLISFINSPFFLSFVAGGFLTLSSLLVTNTLETRREMREVRLSALAAKKEAVKEFADGIMLYLDQSIGIRYREIWLYSHQGSSERESLIYADGRDFDATREMYEAQRIAAQDMRYGFAICMYTKAVFIDSPAVVDSLDRLERSFDTYATTWSRDVLEEEKFKILDLVREASLDMSHHIKEVSSI